MTFYTTFTTMEGIRAAYIYTSKKQLVAADRSGFFKHVSGTIHKKADAGIKDVRAHLEKGGYKVLRPKKADRYDGCDFLLPIPGKEYMLSRCYY